MINSDVDSIGQSVSPNLQLFAQNKNENSAPTATFNNASAVI
jgi:hypothetical protein